MSTLALPSLKNCFVSQVRVTGDHRLAVKFQDALIAELHMGEWISRQHGSMIEPLKSPAFFADVSIQRGVLTWPNGYDIDPFSIRHWAEHGMD
ncbi:DUF2442 domain-containing protein [Prosthecobacter sp. SYSU 5D2]|uniref:DUF2442 domain-containing protein n=1 Tax=Prosthecobacter sp. SYSU 5D2 TaxID=3134134 RepID=UPI0031FE7B77